MTLRRVQVSDFRCLHSIQIELDPKFTLVSGSNASGKTSFLEAIYLLGRGRSFRTRQLEKLIRTGAERFVIFGEVELPGRRLGLGVEGSSQGMHAKMAGDPVASLASLASVLPVQIIDPEVHRLIDGGPNLRRRFLDWGVFHVEHDFVQHWRSYQQVLRQRNAALRSRQPQAAVSAWDTDLVRLAQFIDEARARYFRQLTEGGRSIAQRILGMELALTYRPGWPKDMPFREALRLSWPHDQEIGSTQVGPQRAEIGIRLDGALVKDRISRGQQKLLAAALLMAQLNLFPSDAPVRPTLLLDDPSAELDAERLLILIKEVVRQSVQLVVTGFGELDALGSPGRRYHIDRGVLTSV